MRTKILLLAAAAVLSAGILSCSKTDDEPSGPSNGGGSVPDPEETVLVSMRNDNNGGTKVTLPEVGTFYIDNSDNFVQDRYSPIEFCDVGAVNGLGNIRTAPESGWASQVAVLKGYGYLVRRYNGYMLVYDSYARIYVTDYIESLGGGIMGVYVKYQSPFMPNNVAQQMEFISKFPDPRFREYLLTNYDKNGDKIIDDVEASAVTNIVFTEPCNFEGLSYFPNLRNFYCSKGAINVDVSKNLNLESLEITQTNISSLDVSKNRVLKTLVCENNTMRSYLSLVANPELTYLDCSNNFDLVLLKFYDGEISDGGAMSAAKLEYLDCSLTKVIELDVSNCPKLKYLDFRFGPFADNRTLWLKQGQTIAEMYVPDNIKIEYK